MHSDIDRTSNNTVTEMATTRQPRRARCAAENSAIEETVSRAIDCLLMASDARGASSFFVHGAVLETAKSIENRSVFVLATGFCVAEGMPETDGPSGTAALGLALHHLGKIVIFLSDQNNYAVLRAAVNAYSSEFAAHARFVVLSAQANVMRDGMATFITDVRSVLARYAPDCLIAVEVPGRNATGMRLNMRGARIDHANMPIDELFITAMQDPSVVTVGIGDGGNEIGMAGLEGVPTADDGVDIQSAVGATHCITAWNSNLGAEALAAALLQRSGLLCRMHSARQQSAAILATFAAGAVDGVTRGSVPGASLDGLAYAGVDGRSLEVHRAMLELLKGAIAMLPRSPLRSVPDKSNAFLVGAFDSSLGGLVATCQLERYLRHRCDIPVRFMVFMDHANAPYGMRSKESLHSLVTLHLAAMEDMVVDLIAMACQTACTVFPEARSTVSVPVIDLVSVTVDAIVADGGPRPVLLGTIRTMTDPGLDERIVAASDGRVSIRKKIAAQEWVSLVNDLAHLMPDDRMTAELSDSVMRHVASIPADASSVWLCCTHFPALKTHIEQCLVHAGLGHIPVIDPMRYQADRLIAVLQAMSTERSGSHPLGAPIIVSTLEDALQLGATVKKMSTAPGCGILKGAILLTRHSHAYATTSPNDSERRA